MLNILREQSPWTRYLLFLTALLMLACSSTSSDVEPGSDGDSDSAGDGDSEVISLPFEPAGPDFAPDPMAVGPFPVGVKTIDFKDTSRPDPVTGEPRFLRTEIWYPAIQNAEGNQAVYDLREQARPPIDLGDAAGTLMDADIEPVATDAFRDAEIDSENGPFPIVLFSHGAYALRFQYTFLTPHLASHGYIVVAADHAGNTLWDMLRDGMDSNALGQSAFDRPADFSFLLNQLEKANADPGHWLFGLVNVGKVASVGHSFGGYTAMATPCLDDRFKYALALTPLTQLLAGIGCNFDPYPADLLLMGGTKDNTLNWGDQVCAYDKITGNSKILIELEDAGHFTFSDLCMMDWSVAEIAGDIDPLTDGCNPTENIPYEDAWKMIRRYATAWLNVNLRGSSGSDDFLKAPQNQEFEWVNVYSQGDAPLPEGGCQ